MGMTPEETAAQCYKTALGGVDMLKDDEMHGDTPDCRFEDRLAAVSEALKKAEKKTGKKVIYFASVTDEVDRLNERARRAVKNGATGLLEKWCNRVTVDLFSRIFSTQGACRGS
jgi:2,3-diketo-5-methylthiopentyl-1-phosphate enolase